MVSVSALKQKSAAIRASSLVFHRSACSGSRKIPPLADRRRINQTRADLGCAGRAGYPTILLSLETLQFGYYGTLQFNSAIVVVRERAYALATAFSAKSIYDIIRPELILRRTWAARGYLVIFVVIVIVINLSMV